MNSRIPKHAWGNTPPIQVKLIGKLLKEHGDYSKVARVIGCSTGQVRDYWRKDTKYSAALDDALCNTFPEHAGEIRASSPYAGKKCAECGDEVPVKRARYGSKFCCDECYNAHNGISPKVEDRFVASDFFKHPVTVPMFMAAAENDFTAWDRRSVCA